MSYVSKQARVYGQPVSEVVRAASEVIASIGGKAGKKSRPADGHLEAGFNKKVAGKAFGNRCDLLVDVAAAEGGARVAVESYPVDPIGQKLLFGVLGEPAKLVTESFCAALDARLGGKS